MKKLISLLITTLGLVLAQGAPLPVTPQATAGTPLLGTRV